MYSNVCYLKYFPTRGGGKKYFVTLVNDYTRYCMIYLLASMDETFKPYKNEVENQFDWDNFYAQKWYHPTNHAILWACLHLLLTESHPQTYREALGSLDACFWKY